MSQTGVPGYKWAACPASWEAQQTGAWPAVAWCLSNSVLEGGGEPSPGCGRTVFCAMSWRGIVAHISSHGLSALESVYFAFSTYAWLSHFEQGNTHKKTPLNSHFCCICKFWLWSGGKGVQKPVGNHCAFRTWCLFSCDELLKHFVKTWFNFVIVQLANDFECWLRRWISYIRKCIHVCHFSTLRLFRAIKIVLFLLAHFTEKEFCW